MTSHCVIFGGGPLMDSDSMPFWALVSPWPVGHRGQRRLHTLPDSTVIFVGPYGRRERPSFGPSVSMARL